MVKVTNLTKTFSLNRKQLKEKGIKKGAIIAVNNVSFEAKSGEIFALLGPNGAGKTTALRCIAALINADSGNIFLDDINVGTMKNEARKKMCFLTNELKLDDHFSADYLFDFFGKLHGLAQETIDENKKILFKEFDIEQFKHVKIGKMSSGMKQKTAIAVNLVHDPEIIIFDEPTNGLDVITARAVTDYLAKLKKSGKTVIVSTHIMSIAEKMSDRIAVIIDGEIAINGTLSEILDSTSCENLDDAFFKLYKERKKTDE
ncbi:MAG: ABC transporter ATP-binding protein [Clostridia bacterium]|nr:ABC transporter ATP-binding protein [Clostridia bacterium]